MPEDPKLDTLEGAFVTDKRWGKIIGPRRNTIYNVNWNISH